MLGQHDETCRVVWIILDAGGENGKFIKRSGSLTRHGGRTSFACGHSGGLGVARHSNARNIRQVAIQPLMALRKRLSMGIDPSDGRQ